MRKTCFILLTMAFVVASAGMLHAQNDLYCAVTYEGQNGNRTVAGAVNVECGDGEIHTAPFGNWGVVSFYGGKTDTDQFRGWKHEDGPQTKRHWNSCTTDLPQYHAANCDYYNANNCTTQSRSETVTHGIVTYRSANQCPQYLDPDIPQPTGCANWTSATVSNNRMEIIELDGWVPNVDLPNEPNDDDPVENLYFPSTSVTFTNCSYDGCSEKTSAWVQMTGSSSSSVDVRAELRMKAKAQIAGYCANVAGGPGWPGCQHARIVAASPGLSPTGGDVSPGQRPFQRSSPRTHHRTHQDG